MNLFWTILGAIILVGFIVFHYKLRKEIQDEDYKRHRDGI